MLGDLLEFSSIQGYIRSLLVSEVGINALDKLSPFEHWEDAQARWDMLEQMMHIMRQRRPAFTAIPDIRPLLALPDGAVLEGQDLLKVSGALSDMTRLKKDLEVDASALAGLVEMITPLDDVVRMTQTNLLPTGEVSDLKNPTLRQLRIRYRSVRAAVLERLERILERVKPVVMEDIITIRSDRFVIPMRHDFGTYLSGITHDYSGSRHSVFVEPMEVVEDNNALTDLKSEIREEEYKVLKELTSAVLHAVPIIRANLEAYGALDLLQASAALALKTNAVIPCLGDVVDIKGAHHPVLLERLGQSCIPLDIHIPIGKDGLIISGPNAGGKTVALKTLGLLVMMAKSGLAVPAQEGSMIPRVGRIWIEMDTAQDISHDLSTFTAHAKALKDIFQNVGPGDLVLLDEPGTGTDHDHGGAIAIACIDALRAKGATVVATSHSDLVKLYGLTQPGVENAAVAFDEKGLRPRYTLQYGVIGESRAFEILNSIDFPSELLQTAGDIVEKRGESVLVQAMHDMSQAHNLKEQARREHDEAAALKAKTDTLLKEIKQEKLSAALRYKRLMERLKALAERPIVSEIEDIAKEPEAVELQEVLADITPLAAALDIRSGMQVRIKGGETTGIVQALGAGTAEVLCGTKRITLGLDQIQPVSEVPSKGAKVKYVKASAPVVRPIVVVGLRVDEALPVVEKALDKAMLSGQAQLEIVHGSGTGALKKAIRGYLKDLPFVQSYADGGTDEGGGAVTLVRLKDGPS